MVHGTALGALSESRAAQHAGALLDLLDHGTLDGQNFVLESYSLMDQAGQLVIRRDVLRRHDLYGWRANAPWTRSPRRRRPAAPG